MSSICAGVFGFALCPVILKDLLIQLKELSVLMEIDYTRKYPLRRYILGVLTHTTALDRLWGGDATLTIRF